MKCIFCIFFTWLILNIGESASTNMFPMITEPKKNITLPVLLGSDIDVNCSADLGDMIAGELTTIYWIINGNFSEYYQKAKCNQKRKFHLHKLSPSFMQSYCRILQRSHHLYIADWKWKWHINSLFHLIDNRTLGNYNSCHPYRFVLTGGVCMHVLPNCQKCCTLNKQDLRISWIYSWWTWNQHATSHFYIGSWHIYIPHLICAIVSSHPVMFVWS